MDNCLQRWDIATSHCRAPRSDCSEQTTERLDGENGVLGSKGAGQVRSPS
jgi:hypothetical protein